MGKVKESAINDIVEPKDVEKYIAAIEYKRLFKAILLRLLANPEFVNPQSNAAASYIESARELTEQAMKHLNSRS